MASNDNRLATITRLLLCFAALICFGGPFGGCKDSPKPTSAKTIRVGWQPPWANQGQLVSILKRTDLLKDEGVQADFRPFTYGGPMTEAAIAGEIDVVLAGEQPVLTLLSKSTDWRAVARLTRYRSAIVVPVDSVVRTLNDLSGKTIATAFGSTTHRDLVKLLTDKGLFDKVKLVSLDQAEHASVIERGGTTSWGDLAGIATYDPTIAAAVNKKKARIFHAWASPALVAMHRDLIDNHRRDAEAFLRAYIRAYTVYAEQPSRANAWYSEESRLPLSDADYAEIASFEPNLQAKDIGKVDVSLTEALLADIRRNIEIALKIGILKSKPNIDRLVVRDLIKN